MSDATPRKFAFLAVLILVLAGSTGSLLRFALVYGMPPGWGEFRNVVHAHSHTMFGWAILALMALIWHHLPNLTGRGLPRGVRWQMAATFIFSLLQLPAFWPNGYHSTQIGSAQLPLGAISAGFAGLTWFWFMGLYAWMMRGVRERPLALRLWNWAVVVLLIASLGAMAEPGLLIMQVENPFIKHLFLHLFLDLFTTGWLLLAIFGALWAQLEGKTSPGGWLPAAALALFILPTFLLGMPPDLLSPGLYWVAALSNLVVAGLVGLHLLRFWRRRDELPPLARFGMLGLVVQIGAAVMMLSPQVWSWGVGALRIYYLHDLLLLWASSALMGLLISQFGSRNAAWQWWMEVLWMAGVGLMWLALLAGGFAPWLPISGRIFLVVAAWASAINVLAAILALRFFWRREMITD
ncbi:MAG TPA: hypothetical protein EYP25_09420 [Anaerolineae bacterium]|nr:hypothetical protein [Caldilineae bacterium]HID34765.1 hypothetical protein [Anaerolineae bacterium]HIQ11531.1 hypothetical protein [Caldilineales bacterium]